MSKQIYKYNLDICTTQTVIIPLMQVLIIELQTGKHRLWALVDDDKQAIPVQVFCFGTGMPEVQQEHNGCMVYINTTFLGPYVYHWFYRR